MTDQLELVTYCGLYCGLCAGRARIPKRAAVLQEAMTEEGWPDWGAGIPGFAEFWRFLEGLHATGGCPGCRAGGGFPECQIRIAPGSGAWNCAAGALTFPAPASRL